MLLIKRYILLLLLHLSNNSFLPLQGMVFLTLSFKISLCIRFRYGEDIAIIDLRKSSLEVDLLLAGEASDVPFCVGPWHSFVKAFGRDWLEY